MVTRVFVEKKQGFNIEAQQMLSDLKGNLGIQGLEEVRILNRYDVSGLSQEQFTAAARTILSEPTMDAVYGEDFRLPEEYQVFAMEYLPGLCRPVCAAADPGGAPGCGHRQSHRPFGQRVRRRV